MHIGYAARCNVWSSSSKASPCTASATCAARATHFLPTSSGPRIGREEAHCRPPNRIRRPKVGSHETETRSALSWRSMCRACLFCLRTQKNGPRARAAKSIKGPRVGPVRPGRRGRLGVLASIIFIVHQTKGGVCVGSWSQGCILAFRSRAAAAAERERATKAYRF